MPGLLQRELHAGPALAWMKDRPLTCLIFLGVVARTCESLRNRSPWMDEASLASNIIGHSPFEPIAVLRQDQVAPYGFLVLERLLVACLGESYFVLRLVPFTAGLISVFYFAQLATTKLAPHAALWGLGLFALCDPLVYFGSELKPYIVDVAAVLVVLALPDYGEFSRQGRWRLLSFAAIGAALVWFSFPVVFALAAVGVGWLVTAMQRREPYGFLRAFLVSWSWLLSFAGSFSIARRLLGPHTGMWAFWNFAFPEATWPGWILWMPSRLLYFMANPLQFDTVFGSITSAWLGMALAAAGALRVTWGFRWRCLMMVSFTLLAGAVRVYPFHGRLVLFLVPIALMFIAESLGRISVMLKPRWRGLLVAFIFFWPVVELLSPFVERRVRPFSNLGDLRIDPFQPLPLVKPR